MGTRGTFYGFGSSACLDDLEKRLESGERYLALFCEFPGNPLLNSPDLLRIRKLADKYDFAVVVDETVGNFINTDVLSHADVAVSSLTKVFSGDSNVMGGSAVLNPQTKMYTELKQTLTSEYEDNYWAEDAVFMERNSRDFRAGSRASTSTPKPSPRDCRRVPSVKTVYYPKNSPLGPITKHAETAMADTVDSVRVVPTSRAGRDVFRPVGMSEGTESRARTSRLHVRIRSCALLELEWTSSWGVEPDLVRVSVGLEEAEDLTGRFERALKAAEAATPVGNGSA